MHVMRRMVIVQKKNRRIDAHTYVNCLTHMTCVDISTHDRCRHIDIIFHVTWLVVSADDIVNDDAAVMFHGIPLSSAAKTHTLRRLKTPSRCSECNSYIYFVGAECKKVSILRSYCWRVHYYTCQPRSITVKIKQFQNYETVSPCIN